MGYDERNEREGEEQGERECQEGLEDELAVGWDKRTAGEKLAVDELVEWGWVGAGMIREA